MRNCSKGGLPVRASAWLVSCENKDSLLTDLVIARSPHKASNAQRWLPTCSSATSASISPTPNGCRVPPPFGRQKGGCTWRLRLTCFRGRWQDGLWPQSRMRPWSYRRGHWHLLVAVHWPGYCTIQVEAVPTQVKAIKRSSSKKA